MWREWNMCVCVLTYPTSTSYSFTVRRQKPRLPPQTSLSFPMYVWLVRTNGRGGSWSLLNIEPIVLFCFFILHGQWRDATLFETWIPLAPYVSHVALSLLLQNVAQLIREARTTSLQSFFGPLPSLSPPRGGKKEILRTTSPTGSKFKLN